MKATKTFRYTALTLNILEKILGSKFSVSGIENLPNKPILFVANHFTRSETFFVPYLIYKYTARQVRCLADAGLHHGMLGKFLDSVGTIGTDNPNRDKIIVKDLICGEYDWMIYPEGSMQKNKDITRHDELFISNTPYRTGPVRTGSAVLALKSHLYRKDLIEAKQRGNQAFLDEFKKEYNLEYRDYYKDLDTYVVPLCITYYPIRPGENRIEALARKFMEKVPERLVEELEIEGNLLSNAEINLHFGKPINLAEYIASVRGLIYQIPIIKNQTKTDFIIKYFKHRLTTKFMEEIYNDAQINFDHLFCAALRHISDKEVAISHLKRIIYLSAAMIRKSGKYRINNSIKEENICKIFNDEPFEEFDSIFNLAVKLKEIEITQDEKIIISRSIFNRQSDFHKIRLENTLQVIANEFALLEVADNIVKRNCKIPYQELKNRIFDDLIKKDLDIFDHDYQIYFDKNFSKNREIGRPYYLPCNIKAAAKIKKIGILICHGYKSSPKEVEALARFFNGFGFKVYAVRLKGHGTSPVNLKDTTWRDWYDSVQRGYAILRTNCSKVILVGFSTGGLLSLVTAAKKKNGLLGVVSINAALKLKDIRARMVPGINIWNEMLEKLHIDAGKFEYVDDKPENPNINYSRNYLKGVEQLEKLMHKCSDLLGDVSVPTLIIQAKNDPVVNPQSAEIIYEKIKSNKKMIFRPDFDNHVIINGERKEEVFNMIKEFLHKMNLL